MNKVTYNDWKEIKAALRENDGNVTDTLNDVDWGRTTVRLVQRSKSYPDYKRLTNK